MKADSCSSGHDETGRTSVEAAANAPSAGKRIYAVRVCMETVAMVQADNAAKAIAIAESDAREILRDCPEALDVDVLSTIHSQAELAQHGWDEMCLPYGGDGNTRLSGILPEMQPVSDSVLSGSPVPTGRGQMNEGNPHD